MSEEILGRIGIRGGEGKGGEEEKKAASREI